MPIARRALKTFKGKPGEGKGPDGVVHMGDDFNVADQRRADDLELRGLAVPLIAPRAKAEPKLQNKMEPTLQNKAAAAGPLASAGGRTGEQSGFASLSPPDQVQPGRGSRRPRVERD